MWSLSHLAQVENHTRLEVGMGHYNNVIGKGIKCKVQSFSSGEVKQVTFGLSLSKVAPKLQPWMSGDQKRTRESSSRKKTTGLFFIFATKQEESVPAVEPDRANGIQSQLHFLPAKRIPSNF